MTNSRKMIIGWFSFTCCEDSTILLTEMLNKNFHNWQQLVEFRYFKALKSNNRIEDLDVAFIEGAISSESQADEVRHIRHNSKYVVAIGSCANTGGPSASRNTMIPEEVNYKIAWYMDHFNYNQQVQKLADVIKVDDKVDGCPMDPVKFEEMLTKYINLCCK